jgi:elongation factor P
MISVTELRAGTVYEDQGQIYQVLSYEHLKMGRGSANIKVRVKNLKSGGTLDKSFINGAKVNPITVLKTDMQYLYKDTEFIYFMNPTTFEQINIPIDLIGDDQYYLKEGKNYSISSINGEPLQINLPPKVDLEVIDTGPSLRGNSATNIFKDAVLEGGLKARVPLFIKPGEKVRIDTRTGQYTEKA